MSCTPVPCPEVVRHLNRAVEWRLVSQMLAYPGSGWRSRMELLLECTADGNLREAATAAMSEWRPEDWMNLFGPGGPVRARAVTWEGGAQPGYLLAELEAYYREFSYEPPAEGPPDQLSVLCDFVAWLELKLAYACVNQDSEAEQVTGKALQTFVARFVAPTAWPVLRQLEEHGPEFLLSAARAVAGWTGPEPERRGWTAAGQAGDSLCEVDGCGEAPEIVRLETPPAGGGTATW